MTNPMYSQPQPPQPPKKHHWFRNIVLGAVVFVIALIVVGVAIGGSSKPTAPPVPSASQQAQPAATKPAFPTSPPGAVTVAPSPTIPADQVIAKFDGTALGSTGSFTVPADGNFHISYAYKNGSDFAGQTENFTITEYGTDGDMDQVLVNDLAVGDDTPHATPVYADTEAGNQAYFQVNTEDAHWEIVVLTGTS